MIFASEAVCLIEIRTQARFRISRSRGNDAKRLMSEAAAGETLDRVMYPNPDRSSANED